MTRRNTFMNPWRRTSRWLTTGLTMTALALSSVVFSQASAYSFLATTGTYTELATGTDLPLVRVDTYISPAQAIGFNFVYEGVTYTQFKMTSNGCMSLNPTGTNSLTSNDFSSANATSRPIIAPLWDDNDGNVSTPFASVARYAVSGISPNQVLTVEWRYWQWNYAATGNTISHQVKLYETTGLIEFIYRQEAGSVNSASGSIGIGSATGSGAGSYLNVTNVTIPAVSSTTNTTNLTLRPATGTIYRFTPPSACSAAPSAGTIPSTASYCSPGTTILTSTGFTTGESGVTFQWEESDDNGAGDPWANVVGGSGATTTTYTSPILTSPTVIYYRLKATCSALPGTPGYSNVCTVSPVSTTYAVYNGVSHAQGFEAWVNKCNVTDVPSSNWFNTPSTGNTSWRRDDQGTSAAWGSTSGAYSPTFSVGAYSARFHSYNATSGTQGSLDLYIDMSAATGISEINFDQINTTGSDVLAVLVSTDGGTSFTQLGANIGIATVWTPRTFTMTTNSATTVVRLRGTSDFGGSDIGVDNFRIAPPPTCLAPSALTATAITTVGADLGWTENGIATAWDLEIGVSGFVPTGTPTNNVSSNPYTWLGGSASSTYQFYVRADCGGNGTSLWTGPYSFSTACGAASIPYTQNFESTTGTGLPNCWSLENVNGGSTWTTTAYAGFGSTRVARYGYDATLPGNDWLYTPGLTLVGGTSYTVAYTILNPSTTYVENMDVFWGSSASAGSMTNLIVDHSPVPTTATTVSYTFSPGTSGTYYIGWHAKSVVNQLSIYLDDVSVVVSPNCLPPTNATVTGVTSTNASFSWSAPTGGDPVVGYTWKVVLAGAGSGGAAVATGSGPTLTGSTSVLTPNTSYDLFVTTDCGSETSSATVPVNFFTGYCIPVGTNSQYYLSSFSTTNGTTNITNLSSGFSAGGYGDFTSQSVSKEATGSINFTATWPSSTYTLAIWVDWNQDLTFSAGELAFSSGTSYLPTPASGTIMVPPGTPVGSYRMRVRNGYLGGAPSPCGSTIYGEAEDYTFVVTPPPSCPAPYAQTAANVTSSGADLGWTSTGPANVWDLEIGITGFTPTGIPTVNDAGANPYTWNGGAPSTIYQFYVRADCGSDNVDVSTWSGPLSFTTLCAVEIPDYLQDFTTYLPNCWTEATGPITGPTAFGTSGWLADGYGNVGTTGSARVEIFSTGGKEWLLTPLFDLSAGGYELNFDVALTQFASTASQTIEADDAVYLMQSTDGGTTWTTINTWNNGNSPSNTGNNTTINIAAVTSANVQFGFFMLEGPTSGGDKDFFVDNFKVRVPPTCDATAAPANEDCIAGTYDIVITDVSVTGPGTVQYTLNNGAVQSVPFTSPTTTIAGLNVAQAANITLVTDAGCTNQIGNVQSACAVELDCAATSPLPFQHCYSNGDTRKWYFHTPEVGGAIDLKFLAGSILGAGDNVIFWNGVPGASVQIGSYSGDMSNLTFTGQTNQYLGVSITTNGSGSCQDGLAGTAWNFTVRCSGCTEPLGLVLLPPDNGEVVDCTAGTFEASVYVESFGINGTGPNAGSPPATTTISWTAGGVAQPNIVLTQTSDESGTLTSLGSWPVGVEIDVTLLHGNGETVCNNIIGTDLTIPYSACPPANDICANATVLTIETPANCPGNQVIGTTLGAGQEVTDPTCPTGVGAVQDVWYSVNTTGFANGTLTVTPITATAIGAQFYSACGTTPIGSCISPVSVVNFNFPPGPYLIRFYTTEANAGTFNICISAPPPAANDEPCTATPLALGVGDCVMTSTTNVNATNSTNAGIPAPGCSSFAGGDIWFTTVVGPTGIVTFDSEAGTVTDIGMVVYTSATDCNGPFTLVECDDDDSDNGLMSRIVLSGRTPGEVLYIRVFEYGNNAIGTFSICASEPPLNNNCAGAISLDPSTLACTGANGTTAIATQSLAGCTGNANDDVWYSFVATETSHLVRVSGVGTFNPVLQLINGGVAPDCNALGASIVCQNATGAGGLEEFTAVGLSIGNTYFVRVYDFGATNFLAGTTSFNICVTKVPTCLAPTATAATGITTGTAFANWTPNSGGSGSNFIVEYGLASNFTTPGTGLTAGTNGTVILNAVSPRSLGALAANTQYRYFVRQNCTGTSEGFSFNSNGITFTTLALPPANDECAGAVLLSGSNTTCINTLGTIAGSTRSLPAPDCAGTADDDVWYKFVAEGAGNYTINVNGTPGTLDGVHQLFSGNSCGALTQVACSDPAAMTVQGLTAGQTYFIRVYSYSGVQPTNKEFNICVVKNADCLPPTTITTSNITSSSADVNVAGSLSANYILEYGLQSNFTTPGLAGTAGTNGTVIAFTGNLQQISGLALTTGYRYFVRRDCGTGVYSGNSTAQTFTTLGTPPVNDLCANAIAVTCGNSYAGSNVNATADGVPSQTPGGTATVDDGVWWKYVGNDQTVTLSLCGVSFDTRIHVFAGACGTLVGVAGNDDFCGLQSTVTFGAASGTTYFIAVESFGSISGTINMAVSCGPYCAPPSNNACANAQLITPSPIGFCDPVAGTTACATSTAGANPSCATLFQSYQDVYYTFTAAGSAHPMQVNVLSGTLSYWALYEATCGGQQDFCSTIFGSQVSVTGLTPGAVYKIRIGSQVDADFNICIGAPTCSQDVTVEWQLGATGAIPAWEMRQVGTNVVVASGGGFNAGAPFAVYPETACLPEGKFYFDMLSNLDAGGGYKVRLGQAPFTRLIDNTVAVGSNSITEVTAVPAVLGSNGPLQIPVGPNELLYSSCDKYFWAAGEYIVVNEDPQVAATWLVGQADAAQSSTSGYDFWFYNPDGGYSYIRQRRNNVSDNFGSVGSARTCHMKVNNWAAANHIPDQAQLNVRVRAVVNNVPKNWGPACRFVRNQALAACTPTKLFDIPGNVAYSCNVFRGFTSSAQNRLYARPVSGATKYRFHVYNGETDITLDRTVYYLTLGWALSVAPPLQDEAVYDVTVQAFVGGQWCPVGEVCTVQICNTPASCTNDIAGGQQNSVFETDAAFRMWPNPNNGAQLNVNLSGVEEGTNTVSMDVFDLSGKRIIARTLAVQGGFVSQVVDLNGEISTGMYMVRVTAGDQVYSERLVIQK